MGFMAEIEALGQVDLGVPWSFLAGIKLLMVCTRSFTYSQSHVNFAVVSIIN